jgi:hypothetical protein
MNRILLRVAGGINGFLGVLGVLASLLSFTVASDLERGDTQVIKIILLYPVVVWLVSAAFLLKEKYRNNRRFGKVIFHINLYPILLIFGLLIYERIHLSGNFFLTEKMVEMSLFFAPFVAVHGLNIFLSKSKIAGAGSL